MKFSIVEEKITQEGLVINVELWATYFRKPIVSQILQIIYTIKLCKTMY